MRFADERGSAAIGVALVGLILVMVMAIGLAAAVAASYATAATAADAAALAAAPVTFRPFNARGSPRNEAAAFAIANGATLRSCACPVDPSWAPRTVSVTVARTITLPVVGDITVQATSRATFDPAALLE